MVDGVDGDYRRLFLRWWKEFWVVISVKRFDDDEGGGEGLVRGRRREFRVVVLRVSEEGFCGREILWIFLREGE